MTLSITFSYTGVKYTNREREMLPSLKCTQAKDLGSEHMAGSWARDAEPPTRAFLYLGFLEQLSRGAGAPVPSFHA